MMFRRPYFKGFTQKWQYRAQYVCRPLHVRLLKEICMQNNKSEIFQTACGIKKGAIPKDCPKYLKSEIYASQTIQALACLYPHGSTPCRQRR
jgi:hypothetical protein